MAVSFIASGVVWRWLLQPAADQSGGERTSGLNRLFDSVGLGFLQNNWWTDPTWGIAAIAVPAIWQLSGYVMALFLAGFRGIPEELREAARIDGCSEWKLYRHVIFPQLSPVALSAADHHRPHVAEVVRPDHAPSFRMPTYDIPRSRPTMMWVKYIGSDYADVGRHRHHPAGARRAGGRAVPVYTSRQEKR